MMTRIIRELLQHHDRFFQTDDSFGYGKRVTSTVVIKRLSFRGRREVRNGGTCLATIMLKKKH